MAKNRTLRPTALSHNAHTPAPQQKHTPAADKALMPLGALMLAASMGSWAQTADTAATLSTVTVKDTAEIQSKDTVRLRGFSLGQAGDIYTDGMKDAPLYERDTFNLDRVEVLKGSASMLFGKGSTGGVVNQVNKAPLPIDQHEVSYTLGTGQEHRITGDFNLKTGEDAALRLSAMVQNAHAARPQLLWSEQRPSEHLVAVPDAGPYPPFWRWRRVADAPAPRHVRARPARQHHRLCRAPPHRTGPDQ